MEDVMTAYHAKHKTWIRTIAMAMVCLFLAQNLSTDLLQERAQPYSDTLAPQVANPTVYQEMRNMMEERRAAHQAPIDEFIKQNANMTKELSSIPYLEKEFMDCVNACDANNMLSRLKTTLNFTGGKIQVIFVGSEDELPAFEGRKVWGHAGTYVTVFALESEKGSTEGRRKIIGRLLHEIRARSTRAKQLFDLAEQNKTLDSTEKIENFIRSEQDTFERVNIRIQQEIEQNGSIITSHLRIELADLTFAEHPDAMNRDYKMSKDRTSIYERVSNILKQEHRKARVLLISTNIDGMMNFAPPTGLYYIKAALEKFSGSEVEIIDLGLGTTDKAEIERRLRETMAAFKPDVVGISFTSPAENNAYRVAATVKDMNPNAITVAGGPHPSAEKGEGVFKDANIDCKIIGEGEIAISNLINSIVRSGKIEDLMTVKGLLFRCNGKIEKTGPVEMVKDLDHLPFPRIPKEVLDSYNLWIVEHDMKAVPIITSRGCPYACMFCFHGVFGHAVRYRSPENIVSELEYYVSIGYTNFLFNDDGFGVDVGRVSRLCDLILERGLRMYWRCSSIRVDQANLKLLSKMKKAGCVGISYGIETGSERMLKNVIGKGGGATVDRNLSAIRMAQRAGIEEIRPYLIAGLPLETEADVQMTIDFVRNAVPTNVGLSVGSPRLGSRWIEQPERFDNTRVLSVGGLSHKKDVDKGGYTADKLEISFETDHLTPQDIAGLYNKARAALEEDYFYNPEKGKRRFVSLRIRNALEMIRSAFGEQFRSFTALKEMADLEETCEQKKEYSRFVERIDAKYRRYISAILGNYKSWRKADQKYYSDMLGISPNADSMVNYSATLADRALVDLILLDMLASLGIEVTDDLVDAVLAGDEQRIHRDPLLMFVDSLSHLILLKRLENQAMEESPALLAGKEVAKIQEQMVIYQNALGQILETSEDYPILFETFWNIIGSLGPKMVVEQEVPPAVPVPEIPRLEARLLPGWILKLGSIEDIEKAFKEDFWLYAANAWPFQFLAHTNEKTVAEVLSEACEQFRKTLFVRYGEEYDPPGIDQILENSSSWAQLLKKRFGDKTRLNAAVLDAGNGRLLPILADTLRRSGYEPAMTGTETITMLAAENPDVIPLDVANEENLDRLPLGSQDLIMIDLIESRPTDLLRAAFKYLKTDGMLIVTFAESDVATDYMTLPKRLADLAAKNGFEVTTSAVPFDFPSSPGKSLGGSSVNVPRHGRMLVMKPKPPRSREEELSAFENEWETSRLDIDQFLSMLSSILRIETALDYNKPVFVFSEEVTFDNNLAKCLPKLIEKGIKAAVITKNDKERALIDKLNEGKAADKKILQADTVYGIKEKAARAKISAPRFYYFRMKDSADPKWEESCTISFDLTTDIVKKIIDAIGSACRLEPQKLPLLHEMARHFAEAA